ncbi:MAG: class A beta-lactamase-related serine hydrolase [Actinobacteria bacterium]|nr:class A beta-lactamase-related serine hydrolase [Actinomycetota bacterium]
MKSPGGRWMLAAGLLAVLLLSATTGGGGATDEHAGALTVGPVPRPAVVETPPPAGRQVDHLALPAALAAAGLDVGPGTGIYAARVKRVDGALRYDEFDAGAGAVDTNFWPASTVKLAVAVGTLEFLADLGFSGEVEVVTEGQTFVVADLIQEAIRDSSNEAYDLLLQIVGVDWLNTHFFTAGNGLGNTVVQRSYAGWPVRWSPAMTFTQGDLTLELPEREATGTYACPNEGNCSTLLELSESIRRIVLADEIPRSERFAISHADTSRLRQALLETDGFIGAGAAAAVGQDARVFSKPGESPDDQCVDSALVAPADGSRYLVSVFMPADGLDCATVTRVTQATLSFLSGPPR